MKQGEWGATTGVRGEAGFSLTELVVALAIALILMGIGVPSFLRAYHSYQLSNAASQVADILRLSRYEAIRRNRRVDCVVQSSSTDPTLTNIWADSDQNGVQDPGEKTILLGTGGNLVAAGSVPNTAGLIATAVSGTTPATPSPTSSKITFDARGAATAGNVNVYYLASTIAPEAGYRAVLLMPSGSIQIWASDTSGNWLKVR